MGIVFKRIGAIRLPLVVLIDPPVRERGIASVDPLPLSFHILVRIAEEHFVITAAHHVVIQELVFVTVIDRGEIPALFDAVSFGFSPAVALVVVNIIGVAVVSHRIDRNVDTGRIRCDASAVVFIFLRYGCRFCAAALRGLLIVRLPDRDQKDY